MPTDSAFATWSCKQQEDYVLGNLAKLNAWLKPKQPVGDDHVVLLATLDGADGHKRDHPQCSPWHYQNFSGHCLAIIKKQEGLYLEPNQNGDVDYLVCAWFPPGREPQAVMAAAAIHHLFQKMNVEHRPPWVHEKHAIASLSNLVYSGCKLLQLGRRDQTLVDPDLWARLPVTVQEFATAVEIGPPNYEALRQELSERANIAGLDSTYQAANKPSTTTRAIPQVERMPVGSLVGT